MLAHSGGASSLIDTGKFVSVNPESGTMFAADRAMMPLNRTVTMKKITRKNTNFLRISHSIGKSFSAFSLAEKVKVPVSRMTAK